MKVSIAPDFANLLPPLTAEEIAILTANCQADKNHERMPPIILWKHKNTLVDGHNQYQIRTKLKLKTKFAYIDPETRDEALRYALDVQFGRRNLSASQRAMAYAKLPHNTHGGDRKTDQESILSLETLAEKAGVGVNTMKAAIKVADNSPPQIVKAVAAGEAKANDAVAVMELSPKEQLAALTKKRKGEAKTLKQAASTGEANGKPEAIEDAVGREVPKHLIDVFAAVQEFSTQHKAIAAIKKWAEAMAETKAGSYLHLQSFMATLTEAQKQLKFERPHAVCPYCLANKKSCEGCKGRGFVKRAIYDSAPSELRV